MLSLSACGDPPVTTYRTAKEPAPVIATPAAPAAPASVDSSNANMVNTAVVTASGDSLFWTAPAHWSAKPASAMRKATFLITGTDGAIADLAITAFPGDVGGELANVNRWRGQLQLPPIKADELEKVTKKVQAGDATAILTDFTSEAGDQRMLGAIVPDEKGGRTWFFKVTGPAKAVGGQADKFQKFVESVKL